MPPVTNHECTKSLTQESALKCKFVWKKKCKVNPAIFVLSNSLKRKKTLKSLKFIIIFFDSNIVLHLLIYLLSVSCYPVFPA